MSPRNKACEGSDPAGCSALVAPALDARAEVRDLGAEIRRYLQELIRAETLDARKATKG